MIKPKVVEAAVQTAYMNVAPLPQIKYQDIPNGRLFYVGDLAYAKVELIDQEIHYLLRKPKALDQSLLSLMHFYQEKEIDGVSWLGISTPADNKPGLILPAGLGRFAGTTLRQLSEELGISL
jgi:hypothetical protein